MREFPVMPVRYEYRPKNIKFKHVVHYDPNSELRRDVTNYSDPRTLDTEIMNWLTDSLGKRGKCWAIGHNMVLFLSEGDAASFKLAWG